MTIDGLSQTIALGDRPLEFSGSSLTSCCLSKGSTRDLNLMVTTAQGGSQAGAMSILQHGHAWEQSTGRRSSVGLFSAAAGVCQWQEPGNSLRQRLTINAHTLLWFFDAPAFLNFVAKEGSDPVGWWLEVNL